MNFDFSKIIPKFNFDFIYNISLDDLMKFAFNILFVAIMFFIVIAILDVLNEKYKHDKLFGNRQEIKLKRGFLARTKIFKQFYHNLEVLLTEKEKEGSLNLIFNLSIGFLVFLGVYFITVKQILLAIVLPVMLLKAINKIVKMLSVNVVEKMEEQLPFAIDNTIRIMSKYGDLKSIVYEASRTIDVPLKNALEKVSRKMISGNPEDVLMDFAEEYDNVWIYSLVFILLSYIQDSNKEDTIKNLKHLRNILEKENSLKKASVTDKRYGVVINYAIAVIAGVVGVAQIIINPIGKEFFFGSFTGLICFVGGYSAILFTVMINITMSKAKSNNK